MADNGGDPSADRLERLGKLLGKDREYLDRLGRWLAKRQRIRRAKPVGTVARLHAAMKVRVPPGHLETDIPLAAFLDDLRSGCWP